MTLTELQVLVGSLTNDPNHDRYSLTDVNLELDNTQSQWNEEIKIVRTTTTITVVANLRQYNILGLVAKIPIAVGRVTHKGLDLKKRSKAYFDLYGLDWTTDLGTPIEFCIEASDPNNLYLTLHPTPQDADAGANLVVEPIVAHQTMSLSTDVPFSLSSSETNLFLRPYDFYVAFSTAARLLARDPSEINNARAAEYLKISSSGKANLVQVFKALEAEEPKRMSGGRYWNSGNVQSLK